MGEMVKQIAALQDYERYQDLTWEGSFEDYLQIIRERPQVTRNAFQRLYDMVISYGEEEYIDNKKKLIRYPFFKDPIENGKDAIFGLDIPLMRLVHVLHAAAQGYGPEKRIILLHGPVGSSKSTIAQEGGRALLPNSRGRALHLRVDQLAFHGARRRRRRVSLSDARRATSVDSRRLARAGGARTPIG